ncbi:helix-turn-helix domain-containing protein [Ligilactobacillus apodemi]|uniref:HTH cro/C1-type domain-containing protein n=1 Tax=Ligilactobacillus apodemi DSM 16634 = JCM 16172 TaxID=1423724 RepID=A0A0R1TRH8_9LACO|nr:helix-turn-helix transcriptional regulator [Ligilactobacillus apodemi]KRL84031.1 hypothetical protein FC32_GL001307 [Ligilactobacillus apodemi DSM 16634 = JCM 16172]MCR1900908.1 helix-turn-helix transcriptional regulator [Ligilactobacillus apodemi]
METVFDRIKNLADSRGKSIVDVEADLGLSKNYLYKWKKSAPNSTKLIEVADYFNVSTDYLLGRKKTKDSSEEQETKDLKKFLEDNLDNGMTFGDGKVTQEDREKLEIALTQIFYRYHDEFKKRKNEKGEFKF